MKLVLLFLTVFWIPVVHTEPKDDLILIVDTGSSIEVQDQLF